MSICSQGCTHDFRRREWYSIKELLCSQYVEVVHLNLRFNVIWFRLHSAWHFLTKKGKIKIKAKQGKLKNQFAGFSKICQLVQLTLRFNSATSLSTFIYKTSMYYFLSHFFLLMLLVRIIINVGKNLIFYKRLKI